MKLENLEGLLEGKWENKNRYSHYKLDGEKITFYALEETYDYIIVSNMYQFRDFLKESLKNKTYRKENEKYLRKFLKVCELWLVDYFSRTTYNADTDSFYSEYINEYPTRHSFEISFDEVLKKRKEILKDNEFLILLLKKENLFKKIETYQYMLRTLDKYDDEIIIKFHHFIISFDISNVWNIKHKISIVEGNKNDRIRYNRMEFDDVKYRNETYNEIISIFPKVEKIVEKVAKQYRKKYQ